MRHYPEIQKKMLEWIVTKKSRIPFSLSFLYNKPLRKFEKPKFKLRDSSYLEVWLTLQEILWATVCTESFRNCCNIFQSWFVMHLYNCFQTKHSASLQKFYRINRIWMTNGNLWLRTFPTRQCTKLSQRTSSSFLITTSQTRQNSTIWNPV